MALTRRQLFKFAFLLRCADAGLTPAQACKVAEEGLQKQAIKIGPLDIDMGAIPKTLAWAGNTAKTLGGVGLAGGALTGALGGYTLAKMTDPDVDPEEAKTQELIAAYHQQADRLRRAMALRSYRPKPSHI